MLIDPSILRLMWSIATKIHFQDMSLLPDRELSDRIVREVNCHLTLSKDDRHNLLSYLQSKLMLIRDMAESC